ncbi:MAG: 50S ribosomal protein L25/general stress protein Ctc [Pseudomonadota bacterium]|nr:50S ribosomal protein L25/general stress protein Ctc [Pseudomonadota bacterium]MEC9236783.1 50S ribosomal protein L25/general stress protein Ctc [Pseudomonadota bacterium]
MVTTNYALAAEARDRAGKGVARALRREDKIPAVIYGGKKEPAPISISAHDITIEYHKGGIFTKLCEVDVAGKKEVVLARDVQTHPVSDKVMHVDFLRVTDKTKIVVSVPVKFVDQELSPGIERKAVLNMVRHTIDLLCSAKSIPSEIEVSLAGLNIGDTARYSNAHLPEGSEFADTDRDYTIMTLVASRAMASAAGGAAEGEEEASAEEGEEGEAAEEASEE